jgi:hypothetical protein
VGVVRVCGSASVVACGTLWMSEPLPPRVGSDPPSMYFLALSHAPPVLDMEMANWTPDNRAPVSIPKTALTPKKVPAMRGENRTRAPVGVWVGGWVGRWG